LSFDLFALFQQAAPVCRSGAVLVFGLFVVVLFVLLSLLQPRPANSSLVLPVQTHHILIELAYRLWFYLQASFVCLMPLVVLAYFTHDQTAVGAAAIDDFALV
jgi:hypothetical protein